MIRRNLLSFLFFWLMVGAGASAQLYFASGSALPVIENGDTIPLPWAGGLNFCQFSSMDLDLDGQEDLLVFDRSGDRIVPMIREGNTWNYNPAPAHNFPVLKSWVLAVDYDGDGRKDLFSSRGNGIVVYRNTSGSSLSFTEMTPGTTLQTNYGLSDVNLYVLARDLPAIEDLDGDGDLDILTFVTSTQVEFHRNLSVENYGTRDSLVFELADGCWGNFNESSSSNTIDLGVTCKTNNTGGPQPTGIQQHAGSTLLALDLDADQDRELIIGDFQSDWLTQLTNGGSLANANMTAQDPFFPSYSMTAAVSSFPGAYFVDIDADGNRDLIVSPNLQNNASNLGSVWYYRNTSTDSTPYFDFQQNDFLQDRMIDLGEGAVPVFFDYTGDGLLDLFIGAFGRYDAWATFTPQFQFFENVGTNTAPTFLNDLSITGDYGTQVLPDGHSPAFGDLDGDGDADLLIGHQSGELSYFENTAGSGFAPAFSFQGTGFANIDVGNFAAPAMVDLDRDGLTDLVVGEQNGNLNYFRNTGSVGVPTFAQVTDTLGKINVSAAGSFGQGFSVPRFYDANGTWELFVGRELGTVFHCTDIDGNLSGAFTVQDTILTGADVGIRSAPAVGDLNSDGWPELVIGNYAGGVNLWMGIDPAVGEEEPIVEAGMYVTAYPNPAEEKLNLRVFGVLNVAVKWELWSMMGQRVKAGTMQGEEVQIGLADVESGVYVLLVKTAIQSQVLRLVVK